MFLTYIRCESHKITFPRGARCPYCDPEVIQPWMTVEQLTRLQTESIKRIELYLKEMAEKLK